MILIYTGDGKGKTCACVGQALRAMGMGLSVGFAQFIKRDCVAGEQEVLHGLTSDLLKFRAGGIGFFIKQASGPCLALNIKCVIYPYI